MSDGPLPNAQPLWVRGPEYDEDGYPLVATMRVWLIAADVRLGHDSLVYPAKALPPALLRAGRAQPWATGFKCADCHRLFALPSCGMWDAAPHLKGVVPVSDMSCVGAEEERDVVDAKTRRTKTITVRVLSGEIVCVSCHVGRRRQGAADYLALRRRLAADRVAVHQAQGARHGHESR